MIIDKKRAFSPLTPKEIEQKIEREGLAKKQLTETAILAVECLRDEKFERYRKMILDSRLALVEVFLSVDDPDPMREWKLFKELQSEMNVILALHHEVFRDLNADKK